MTEWLIVGLGNPGREYELNRHNIGFMAVDNLGEVFGQGNEKSSFQGLIRSAIIQGTSAMLLKPQTYMNLSGESVGACARFYKIPVERVIVMHDELDIAAGTVKVKQGGGHAGHNGLKSIDQHFGNNYWRVRLGIGHPGEKHRVTGHVLGNFTDEELTWVDPMMRTLTENFALLFKGQSAKFTAQFTPAKATEKD